MYAALLLLALHLPSHNDYAEGMPRKVRSGGVYNERFLASSGAPSVVSQGFRAFV